MRLGILIVCGVLSVGVAEELPSFIKKCSLKDPEISKCIITNGNLAIPELLKGSSFFGVPSAIPLHISSINLPGNDFTVTLSNVRLYGLQNVRITDVSFKADTDKFTIVTAIPYLNLTADYTTITNDLFFPGVIGGGKLRINLVDDVFTYSNIRQIIVRDGTKYFKLSNQTASLKTKRIFYHFSDFFTSNAGDFNEFLNSHKRIVDERIKPGVEKILFTYIAAALSHLAVKLPADDHFEIFSFEKKQTWLTMIAPHLNLIGDYTIISNDLFFPQILGIGKLNAHLDTNLFRMNGTADRATFQRAAYFDVKDDRVALETKRIFYKFSDIYATPPGDFVRVLNSYKLIVDERIIPAVEEIVHKYVITAVMNVTKKISLVTLFDF